MTRKSLCTANLIESLNSGIRNIPRRAKHLRNFKMVIRWVCTGIVEIEKKFRKVKGYDHIDSLLINIESCVKKVIAENKQLVEKNECHSIIVWNGTEYQSIIYSFVKFF
jgi:hypothetical protein